MNDAQSHYEKLLAQYYTWMQGDYASKVQENMAFFRKHRILPRQNGRAIDLGCGSGFQSIALADMGFQVLSIDFCQALLDELESHRENRSIHTCQADLLDFNQVYTYDGPQLIVCMGDTLTHLASLEDVAILLQRVNSLLEPGGRFIVTYRDMTQELIGLDRFIPLRSDQDKIMTTFLEYQSDCVVVHDLVYSKNPNEWVLHKSSYKKLRISNTWLIQQFFKLGMSIEYTGMDRGFTIIIAAK
jgi:SAM-dependent methyltransferase